MLLSLLDVGEKASGLTNQNKWGQKAGTQRLGLITPSTPFPPFGFLFLTDVKHTNLNMLHFRCDLSSGTHVSQKMVQEPIVL
jgi:hypothetical protein